MKTTLGGDRLGSGNKQEISTRNYNRSTHDLSWVFRSTTACGTLVPFMNELALPGDNFKIDLETLVKTNPTIAPLFGSFKIQLDVFLCPIRLFQGALQMNKLNVGLDMSKVKLPTFGLNSQYMKAIDNSHEQINSSCIFRYFDIGGLGNHNTGGEGLFTTATFQALKWLNYWEIYRNYYANKQEEEGAVIHTPAIGTESSIGSLELMNIWNGQAVVVDVTTTEVPESLNNFFKFEDYSSCVLTGVFDENFDPSYVFINFTHSDYNYNETISLTDIFAEWTINPARTVVTMSNATWTNDANGPFPPALNVSYARKFILRNFDLKVPPKISRFPLENIETMRETILSTYEDSMKLTQENTLAPYKLALESKEYDGQVYASIMRSQEGLGIKTYQSDLFNNWISTEWIDGENGVNQITAIDTSSGSFTLDTFNLQRKIYEMLNRVAISGGGYNDYIEATYEHTAAQMINSPMYIGGLSRELVFEEIVSSASASGEPLGTLAGKGRMGERKKGGHIEVRVDEPSYIVGIFSLTPRIDYSQGTKWDNNLRTFDDFHKPALDEIGYQDLITQQMASYDSYYNWGFDNWTYKSAGKQPAWINYMTNVNKVYGNFAKGYDQSYMVLNRNYEADIQFDAVNGVYVYSIKDLTTYIDPQKFNHIFAYTSRDAQNFWVQIAIDMEARRKMSAKVIPNL